ncbi:MAG: carboxymuconolactone decarboxylase family protein [Spirochaetes bacterium]|nr:carboxymuconolactone decarboxylase family protein [Spirochaetota bacterium]
MFGKRIFTFKSLLHEMAAVFINIPSSISARLHKRIDRVFAEKIRLAVTSVNGCIYCSYGHTKIAMIAGIPQNDIELLLKGEIGDNVSSHETPALLFAQHYAETGGKPDPSMLMYLNEFYGSDAARDILVYLREIQFGNLSGNTFEAFISRLKRNASPGSNVCFEAAFFILSFSLLGMLHILVRQK